MTIAELQDGETREIQIRPVETEADWKHVQAIRTRVFIEEQHCPPELEWDAFEETSRHFLGFFDGKPIATARWRTVGFEDALAAKLERFAVLPEYRDRGFGREMVRFLMRDAHRAGFDRLVLHAQAHLEKFYRALGFKRAGEPFEEAGIPHVPMRRG